MRRDTLDVCCGGRMWWFDKADPGTVYCDWRMEERGASPTRPNWHVRPDVLSDFRRLPFPDRVFRLVVFDPPHVKRRTITGNTITQYGALDPDTWSGDIRRGFAECWRVLVYGGTLVFKWAGLVGDVRDLFPAEPMVGTRIMRESKAGQLGTSWFVFHKREQAQGELAFALPSVAEFVGSDPSFTGDLTTQEYMDELRGESPTHTEESG